MAACERETFFAAMSKELTSTELVSFGAWVDEMYRAAFIRHYSTYTRVKDFCLPREKIVGQYSEFRKRWGFIQQHLIGVVRRLAK